MRSSFPFAVLLLAKVAASAVQAIGLLVLARVSSPGSFGHVNTVLSASLLLATVLDFGQLTYVAKMYATGHLPQVRAALRMNATTTVLGSVVTITILTVVAAATNASPYLIALGIAVCLEKNVETVMSVPTAAGHSGTVAISLAARRCTFLALLITGVLLDLPAVPVYCIALLLGSAVGQAHARVVVTALKQRVRGEPIVARTRIVRESLPYFVSNLSSQARLLDLPVVAAVSGSSAAGLYSAATRLVQPLMLLPATLTSVMLPRSATMSTSRAKQVALRLALGTAFSAACLAGLTPWSTDLVAVVLGDPYAGAAPILSWTLIGLPFLALPPILGALLQGQHRQKLVATNGAVYSALLVPSLWAAAVTFGATGVAIAVAAIYFLKSTSLLIAAARL